MKRLALTQPALNLVARTPEGRALLRELREAEKLIEKESAKFKGMVGKMQGLVDRIRIALGEVSA